MVQDKNDPEVPQQSLETQDGVSMVDKAIDTREKEGEIDPKKEIGESLSDLEKLIGGIDSEKSLNEQLEARAVLEIQLEALIYKALESEISLEEIKESPLKLSQFTETPAQELALEKLEEIIQATQSSEWFDAVAFDASKEYEKIHSAKEKIEKGETPKEMRAMGSIIRVGLVAAGAYGLYKVIKYFKKQKTERKKGELLFGGALTALGLGALIGPKKLGEWSTKHLGLAITGGSIGKFFENLFKGDFTKARESISFDAKHPGIESASKKWDIPKYLLIDWKDMTLEEIKESTTKNKALGYLDGGLDAIGIDLSGNIPLMNLDDRVRAVKHQQKLITEIQKHRPKLKDQDISKMTLSQILSEYEKLGVFEETPKEEPKQAEKPEKGLEEMSKISPVKAAIDKWNNGIISGPEAAGELIGAAIADGGAVFVEKDESFLVWGGKVMLLSNIAIVSSTINNVIETLTLQKDILDVPVDFTTGFFEAGGIYWVGASSIAAGAVKAYQGGNKRAVAGALLKGGAKGVINAHLFIPKTGGQSFVMGKQSLQVLALTSKEYAALTPQEKLTVMRERAAYHGKLFKHYHDMKHGALTGKSASYKYLAPRWSEFMLNMHGKAYMRVRDRFLKLASAEGIKLKFKADVKEGGFAESIASKDELSKEVDKFLQKAKDSKIKSASEIFSEAPKHNTLKEAAKAGVKLRANPGQITKLTKLGFSERTLVRLAELELEETELDQLIGELETNPKLKRAFETVVTKIKTPKLYKAIRALKLGIAPAAILMTLYEFDKADDKVNFLAENTVGGISAWGAATAATYPIPNPVAKILVGAVAGTAAYLGGAKAYDMFGKPIIERHFPNAERIFDKTPVKAGKQYLDLAFNPMMFINTVSHVGDTVFSLGDAIDAETDPMKYLQVTNRFMHPKTWMGYFSGDFKMPLQEHKPHDLNALRENAKEALRKAEDELENIEADPIKEKELKLAIAKYEKMIDDSWIKEKELELVLIKINTLVPANEQFRALAKANYGDEGAETYDMFMEKINSGEKYVETESEDKIWKLLYGESINLEGQKIQFPEFIALSIGVSRDMEFIKVLKGEIQKSEPNAESKKLAINTDIKEEKES